MNKKGKQSPPYKILEGNWICLKETVKYFLKKEYKTIAPKITTELNNHVDNYF